MKPYFRRAVALSSAALAGLAATASVAADLPTKKDAFPAPAVPMAIDYYQPFYLKLGFTYALNSTSSQLWAQNPTAMARGNLNTFPLGVGATIGDVSTVGLEGGVFVTRNVSLDVSLGLPFFVDDKTKGYNPANPVLPNGTVLARIKPGFVPVTLLYHFDNFGAFRPYLGGGFAPGFSLSNQNAFITGVRVGTSVGPVLQAGFDYMLTPNWGVTADVKKTFTYTQSSGTGMNIPGHGWFPAASYQHTHFQPWTFSVGIVYAFGKSGILPTF